MANSPNDSNRPNPPRRRRKRSKWRVFKEAYLPVILIAAAIVLIVMFVRGSLERAEASRKEEETIPPTSTQDSAAALQDEAEALMARAEELALIYDYNGALETLTSFSGDMTAISGMVEKYNEYSQALSEMVAFKDVDKIPNLSFNTLIADVTIAQSHPKNGENYSRDHIAATEFSAILQELYDNGYMLVSLHDLISPEGMNVNALYLPKGKKPIVLTLTDANYDADMATAGSGFASKLILDNNGALTNEMIDTDGSTVTGNLDFIPILSAFVAEHPDFSCQGARAIIAVSGHDGIFGYPTLTDAQSIIDAVKAEGYEFACYTYEENEFGSMTAAEIDADLSLWTTQVEPLLGEVDLLVYPYGSDFTEDSVYTGEEYRVIRDYGFHYLIGTDTASAAWGQLSGDFYLQTRRWVNGRNLAYRQDRYADLFDASAVLDQDRTAVPQ